jgi:hypothetical protein
VLTGNPAKTLDRLFALADQLDAPVPKPVRDQHATLAALGDKVRALNVAHDVPGVTLAALEAGRDPYRDPAVAAEVVRAHLTRTHTALADELTDRAASFLDDHVADVWAAFTPPFDTAADTLRTALDRLGDTPLDDTHRVLSLGGNAADVWATAQRAEATVRNIRNVWKLLGAACPTFPAEDPKTRLLIIADIPADRWVADKPGDLGAWDALRAGHSLSLATPDTYRQRVAAITELRAGRQQQAQHRQEQAAFGKRVPAAS